MMTSTFQFNKTVVSKLIWLEVELNVSQACFEKHSDLLYCQCRTSVDSDVTASARVRD